MIRQCGSNDIDTIYEIINMAATAYDGAIPADRYHQPYMPLDEPQAEMQRVIFYGWEEDGRLVGVMGIEPIRDVTLIRHAYVLPQYQNRGLGRKLLEHLKTMTTTPRLLVGTWADATRAVDFYRRQGFALLQNKDSLLSDYRDIPWRQVETSVVLGLELTGMEKGAL